MFLFRNFFLASWTVDVAHPLPHSAVRRHHHCFVTSNQRGMRIGQARWSPLKPPSHLSIQISNNDEFVFRGLSGEEQDALRSINKELLLRESAKIPLKKCPIFSSVSKENINLLSSHMKVVSFGERETFIHQGDPSGSLYFIKSGTFHVFDEKTGAIIATLDKEHDLFGELAAVLNRKRSYSIRTASNNCAVWELPIDKFANVMDETVGMFETAVTLLKAKYEKKTFWGFIAKSSFKDAVDLAKTASRPKKKPVSFHSRISGMVAAASIIIFLPHVSPKLWPPTAYRWINLTTELPSLALMRQIDICAIGLAVSLMLGLLRFPPKTTYYRKIAFRSIGMSQILATLIGLSNLIGPGTGYLIDAWSWPGRMLIVASAFSSFLYAGQFFAAVIFEPEKDKGSIPFFESRRKGIATMIFYTLSLKSGSHFITPMFESRRRFETITSPLYDSILGNSLWSLKLTIFMVTFYFAWGGFVATLQFEKKHSVRTCNIMLAIGAAILLIPNNTFLANFVARTNCQLELAHRVKLAVLVPTVFGFIRGAIRKFDAKQGERSK